MPQISISQLFKFRDLSQPLHSTTFLAKMSPPVTFGHIQIHKIVILAIRSIKRPIIMKVSQSYYSVRQQSRGNTEKQIKQQRRYNFPLTFTSCAGLSHFKKVKRWVDSGRHKTCMSEGKYIAFVVLSASQYFLVSWKKKSISNKRFMWVSLKTHAIVPP